MTASVPAPASARRQALADLARSRRTEGPAGRNLRVAAGAVVALGILGLLGLWLSGLWRTPPELLAIRASVDDEIARMMEAARSGAAYAPAADSPGALFQLVRHVPEAHRERAREEIGRLFEAREAAEVESYFALPPDQRAAELDRRIRAEEQRRQAREAERSHRAAQAGVRAGGTPQPGAAGPPPAGRRRDVSEEGRNARSKRRLDKTSAEWRARRTEYRRAKDRRRIQLGLAARG